MMRRGLLVTIGLSALVLGLVALVAWPIAASTARSDVIVYPDARTFVCAHSETSLYRSGEGSDATYTQSVAADAGLDCSLRVHVQNNSSATVDITRVSFDLLGPYTGGPAVLDMIDGQKLTSTDDASDALLNLADPIQIEAGDDYLLVSNITFNPNGCNEEGSAYTFFAPTVTVSALGLSGERDPGYGAFSVTGTTDSHTVAGCTG